MTEENYQPISKDQNELWTSYTQRRLEEVGMQFGGFSPIYDSEFVFRIAIDGYLKPSDELRCDKEFSVGIRRNIALDFLVDPLVKLTFWELSNSLKDLIIDELFLFDDLEKNFTNLWFEFQKDNTTKVTYSGTRRSDGPKKFLHYQEEETYSAEEVIDDVVKYASGIQNRPPEPEKRKGPSLSLSCCLTTD